LRVQGLRWELGTSLRNADEIYSNKKLLTPPLVLLMQEGKKRKERKSKTEWLEK
jgi:hypothetical protein